MQTLPDAAELDRAAGGRRVYLSQASIHSALVSSALLAACPQAAGAAGFDASGWLRRDAHHVVRAAAHGLGDAGAAAAAQRAALRAGGVAGDRGGARVRRPGHLRRGRLHRAAGARPGRGLPEVYGYWGELGGAARARELGAVGAGGDLYADGALGSRTAHLSQPYLRRRRGCGHGYLTRRAGRVITWWTVRRTAMQGGFHAIGDAAIGTVLAGFAAAAASGRAWSGCGRRGTASSTRRSWTSG